jgi:NTP pyrophosphatase (non-canonical NTP hydrolase)
MRLYGLRWLLFAASCRKYQPQIKGKDGLLNLADYSEIYRAAVQKWGRDAQFEQVVEECAELIAAIKHFRRGKVAEQVVVNELADVLLMVGQMVYMLGEKAVHDAVAGKIEILKELLADRSSDPLDKG